MRKLFYAIAIISALATASFADKSKNTPIKKPESMSQQEWNGRVLGAVNELRKNPWFYDMLKGNQDPVFREAARIYEENYLK